MLLLHTGCKTSEARQASPATTSTFYTSKQLATTKGTQSFAGHAQYLFLAIPAARFFLRELLSVLGDKWGGRFHLTPQIRRDMQWWTHVPRHANGKNIHRLVKIAYIHGNNSGYGWGAVLNDILEASGLWGTKDGHHHITWKELKAVRQAVLSCLPHLDGRNIHLHEDT
jgi:hypothetical protein